MTPSLSTHPKLVPVIDPKALDEAANSYRAQIQEMAQKLAAERAEHEKLKIRAGRLLELVERGIDLIQQANPPDTPWIERREAWLAEFGL